MAKDKKQLTMEDLSRRVRRGWLVIYIPTGQVCRVLNDLNLNRTSPFSGEPLDPPDCLWLRSEDDSRDVYNDVTLDQVRPYTREDWADQEAFQAWHQLDDATWMKVPSMLALLRKPQAEKVLSKLIHWQGAFGQREWFYCTDSTLSRELYMDPQAVKRTLRWLRDRRMIFTRKAKGKHQREICINYKKLLRVLNFRRERWYEHYYGPRGVKGNPPESPEVKPEREGG